MGERLRYRLQRKEPTTMPSVIGNRTYPLPTYRWKDIAMSDDKAALVAMIKDHKQYRVIDTYEQKEAELNDCD